MTINKAQGQTFRSKVGVYIYKDVFSHEQLCVALSRVTDPSSIKVGLPCEGKTKNIVLKKYCCNIYSQSNYTIQEKNKNNSYHSLLYPKPLLTKLSVV